MRLDARHTVLCEKGRVFRWDVWRGLWVLSHPISVHNVKRSIGGLGMSKLPGFLFYPGDWLKDPKLSMCHPASRGIWADLICAMHELDRKGELRGTTEELARLTRCSAEQLVQALADLKLKEAANIEQRNGSWLIVNRRMKREAEIREKRAVAGSKRAAKVEQVPEYENEEEGLLRVREFARGEGIPDQDAEWFFWKCQGNGWTNGGKPIRDWKATLRCWFRAGYTPSKKVFSRNGSTQSRPPDPRQEKTEREAQEARAKLREFYAKKGIAFA